MLRNLTDADIRHVTESDDSQSEGRRKISWIWNAGAPSNSPGEIDALQDSLQECEFLDIVPTRCGTYDHLRSQPYAWNGARRARARGVGRRRSNSCRRKCAASFCIMTGPPVSGWRGWMRIPLSRPTIAMAPTRTHTASRRFARGCGTSVIIRGGMFRTGSTLAKLV